MIQIAVGCFARVFVAFSVSVNAYFCAKSVEDAVKYEKALGSVEQSSVQG
jgi:hypothetical protein